MAESFFIENEMLKSKYNKYILINTKEEKNKVLQAIKYLLQRKIAIEGIISENAELIGETIYNRRIIDIKELNRGILFNNELFPVNSAASSYITGSIEQLPVSYNIRNVNQNIKDKIIVIYGCGKNGVEICKYLHRMRGGGIKCFIDSNPDNVGKVINNVIVYGPEIIKTLSNETIIIEAFEKWWEIDEKIRAERTDLKCLYYTCNNNDDLFIRNLESKEILFSLIEDTYISKLCDRNIFIYGTEGNAREVYQYFKILGLSVKGLLIDKDMKEHNFYAKDIPVTHIDEIIEKKDIYFIWIEQHDKCNAIGKLKLQGLQMGQDFGGYFPIKYVLDINLGISYKWKHEYAGITAYGREKENDYKIVVLGNSTTDSTKAYPHKSWVELLYSTLNKQDLTIYNAGVGGYFSGQELLKLIRDCRELKPDLIISYSGINDMGYKMENYPFAFSFEKEIYKFAYEDIVANYGRKKWRDYLSIVQGITYGVPLQENRFNNWLKNEELMYAVAKCYSANFVCFLQPAIYTKQNTEREKSIIKNHYMQYKSDYSEMANLFRSEIKSIISKYSYIYDLSHIFDEIDVYEDICHVNQEGNRIIAEEIIKVIQKYI